MEPYPKISRSDWVLRKKQIKRHVNSMMWDAVSEIWTTIAKQTDLPKRIRAQMETEALRLVGIVLEATDRDLEDDRSL